MENGKIIGPCFLKIKAFLCSKRKTQQPNRKMGRIYEKEIFPIYKPLL